MVQWNNIELETDLRTRQMNKRLLFVLNVFHLVVQIFLINLKRRLDRRTRMLKSMTALGLHASLTDAVDGK